MQAISVGILSEDRNRLSALEHRLESTQLARVILAEANFPKSATDPVLRQFHDSHVDVVVVDINPDDPHPALTAIELFHFTGGDVSIFAAGELSDPAAIISAMRAGAREFIDRGAGREALLDALTRHSTARSKRRTATPAGRIFTFVNVKGGSGATVTAVNIALALQQAQGQVILVDFAPIGHASLQLNLKANFGIADALQNIHRMDGTLLDGLVTPHRSGLHLLAGASQVQSTAAGPPEIARLFDLLVNNYSYVIVDCSTRMDIPMKVIAELSNMVLLIAQTDVVSLWSAGRMHTYLKDVVGRDRMRLLLNRYKKIPGFSYDDIENASGCPVLWQVPNHYQAVAACLDKGTPIVLHSKEEVSRSFIELAALLSRTPNPLDQAPEGAGRVGSGKPNKKAARLLISPARAGH